MIDPADHLGLAFFWAKRLGAKHPIEDSQQFSDACLALVLSAKKFKPDMGCKFSTYASKYIQWSILGGFASRRHYKRKPSKKIIFFSQLRRLPQVIDEDEQKPERLQAMTDQDGDPTLSTEPTAENVCVHSELGEVIKACEKFLDPRRLDILHGRFIDNLTLGALGKKYRITKERVRGLQQSALSALREHIRRSATLKQELTDYGWQVGT